MGQTFFTSCMLSMHNTGVITLKLVGSSYCMIAVRDSQVLISIISDCMDVRNTQHGSCRITSLKICCLVSKQELSDLSKTKNCVGLSQ